MTLQFYTYLANDNLLCLCCHCINVNIVKLYICEVFALLLLSLLMSVCVHYVQSFFNCVFSIYFRALRSPPHATMMYVYLVLPNDSEHVKSRVTFINGAQ